MMVNNYKASGHLLGPVLGVILRHPKMWENLDAPDLVKPPIVFVASGLRAQDKFITQNSWSWILEGMGQVPFYPPNVSGWKQGPGFLNTNTVRAYWTAADYLLGYQPPDPGTQTPTQAVTGAIAVLGGPWVSLDSRTKLLDLRHHLRDPARAARPARPHRATEGAARAADGRPGRAAALTREIT